MKLIEVYIEHTNLKLNNSFTYLANDDIKLYTRVKVSFGLQTLIGFVVGIKDLDVDIADLSKLYNYEIKEINEIIDDEPLLNEELYELSKEMAYRTVSPLISCLNTILPPNLKPKTTKNKISYETYVRKISDFDKLTPKQKDALTYLNEDRLYSDFRKQYASVVKKLKELNLIELYEKPKKNKIIVTNKRVNDQILTIDQQKAYDKLLSTDKKVSLLHGITGSGKTEIYLQLARHYVDMGKQVLILVPEISLTPQMVLRVQERFFDDVAIYHSNLTSSVKYQQYLLVKNNEVKVVVGTRSSIFMPFDNLGLIIIDEEHDSSYYQDKVPSYNTIDIAMFRSEYHNAKIILGSATPSLETYSRAIKGVYELVELKKRINNQLPDIKIIDLNKEVKNRQNYIITNTLKKALDECLSRKEQAIILINRRGYFPILKCQNCNEIIKCPNCDVALNYHKDENVLKCHICDFTISCKDIECPNCHSHRLSSFGYGIQKVEEILKEMYPNNHIERMDHDTAIKKSHEAILKRFENHEIDILIGTQMIAKGLDFPNVTLVAILNGDSGLNRIDYLSQELVFDLIMQASGRSGRHKNKGQVFLQVYDPNHYVVKSCVKQDYQSFFVNEMKYRHQGQYPPYTYLVAIYTSHFTMDEALRSINYINSLIDHEHYRVLGPTNIIKIKGMNRYRLILKGKDLDDLIKLANYLVDEYRKQKFYAQIKVEVNPKGLE